GLDVDDRRAVQHVDGLQVEPAGFSVDADEPYDVQADRIGPDWGTQGENAFGFRGMARFLDNQIPWRVMQPCEDGDMADAFQPGEAGAIGRIHDQGRRPASFTRGAHVLRAVLAARPRRGDA